jgi:uncharacterized protein YrzB (UPF0473 family)
MGKKEHDHDHDHDHDEDESEFDELEEYDEDDDIVILQDADGNEKEFRFLTVVELEGEGAFALLTPNEEPLDEDAPTEVFIFRYEQDEEGGEIFSDLDDEDLFQRVQKAAEALLNAEAEEEIDN